VRYNRTTPGGRRRRVAPSYTPRTLSDARRDLLANLDDGVECECCGQYSKRYRRKLNSGMARVLVWLVRECSKLNGGWVNVAESAPTFVRRSNEVSRLVWWGLVEERPNDEDPTRRSSGIWRPTRRGIAFANGNASVQERVVLYNNRCEGFEGDLITIRDALGSKFDYDELMRA
jgi:hypothetical protein